MAAAYERCRSEARQAFGDDDLYVEQFLPHARHVEVQIVGDGAEISHLWDRECSVQRQRQKLIETAPALGLSADLRAQLLQLAAALGKAVNYRGLGTIEFLVDQNADGATPFAFIEANPRLQVEHTVTEAITGLDLVRIQLQLAAGLSLAKLGLRQFAIAPPRGIAIQARVNLEMMNADGSARPTGGTLSLYEPATGPAVRVDGFGYSGYRTSGKFDSLLAKVIVHAADGDLAAAARKAERALAEFRIGGRGDQHSVPACFAPVARLCRRRDAYALRRRACSRIVRRGSRADAGRTADARCRPQNCRRGPARSSGARQK